MQERFADAHVRGGASGALWYAMRDLANLLTGAVVARLRGWRARGARTGRGVWRRETRGMSVLNDVLYAFRGMRRNPAYTAIIVITLGVGIGANTAIFSVLNAVLLRPLSYEEPEQLVVIWDRFDRMDTRQVKSLAAGHVEHRLPIVPVLVRRSPRTRWNVPR